LDYDSNQLINDYRNPASSRVFISAPHQRGPGIRKIVVNERVWDGLSGVVSMGFAGFLCKYETGIG
jgi:hypothetical protein